MFSVVCIVGLLLSALVYGFEGSLNTPAHECIIISNQIQCNTVINITCREELIMVIGVMFAEINNNNVNKCPKCFDLQNDQLVNVSGSRYDVPMNITLGKCSLQPWCTLWPLIVLEAPYYVISIKYKCVPGNVNSITEPELVTSTPTAPPTHETDVGESTLAHSMTTVNDTAILTNATSEYNTSTFEAAGDGSSVIWFLTGGSFAFLFVLAITGILVYRRRRRKEANKSPLAPATNPLRFESIDSLGFQNVSMQDAVDSDNACQTVAHIPLITRGSAEYAVSMPPGIYNYALTYHKSSASETIKSISEQTGSSQTDVTLADAKEGICNPYFILLPLNEQEIGATKKDSCTNYSVCGADDDRSVAPINAEQSMHVYNHIMIGRGATEDENENGVMCSDKYSHISIDEAHATGSRSEPADDYCHIGQNNATFHAHVTREDYNHVVL